MTDRLGNVDHFGARLHRARRHAGMGAHDLARRAGVGRSTLFRLEQGQGLPAWPVAIRLAQALCCSLDWLAGIATHPGDPYDPPKEPIKEKT